MMVLYVLMAVLTVVMATVWIWLPILIIVLVRRSRKKAEMAALSRTSEVVESAGRRVWTGGSWERREELNQKIYAELKKEAPDMKALKWYVKEVEELDGVAESLEAYSYHGAGPESGVGRQSRAAVYSKVAPAPSTRSYSGTNAILYVGSLLVVAGVGVLVMTAVPDAVKMMVMLVIIAIFYVGGLLIRRDERLVGAGKALVGTALAIIPFLGFAFASFLDIPGEVAWLMTSIVGLGAYVLTTVLLSSRVIAYLSMAFLISMCLSMTATMALPMLYYFMFVMVVGVVAGLVRIFAGRVVPKVFSEVVDVTGRWLTLVTLVASLCFVGSASEYMYVWLFWIAAVQTGVMWLGSGRRLGDEMMFRLLTHAAVLVTVLQMVDGDLELFGTVFWGTAVVHGAMGMVLSGFLRAKERAKWEVVVQLLMMLMAGLAWVFVLIGVFFVILGGDLALAGWMCFAGMVYIGVGAGVMAAIQKEVGWLYGVMLALVLLPWIFGNWVLVEIDGNGWSAEVYYVVYLMMMAGMVLMRWMVGKREKFGALGLVGVMMFGLVALLHGWLLDVGFQVLGLTLWTMAIVAYGWMAKLGVLYEIAVYFGALTLCRVANAMLVEMSDVDAWTHVLTYAHIWAVALIGASLWWERRVKGVEDRRMVFAVGLLTMVVGGRALAADGGVEATLYPMWFLILQVVLVVFGGMTKQKWMWVWGVCGVVVAIMWFLREMAYAWLILLGFGLIALVVWSLLRPKKS